MVGAAETTKMGQITEMSELQLQADAALNAMADAGLTAADIDGIATAASRRTPSLNISGLHRPGLTEHSLAELFYVACTSRTLSNRDGLCTTVLIVHGESGRSRVEAEGFPEFMRAASWPASLRSPTAPACRQPCLLFRCSVILRHTA